MVNLRDVVIAGSLSVGTLMSCAKTPPMAPATPDYSRISTDCVGLYSSKDMQQHKRNSKVYNCQLLNFSKPIKVVFNRNLVGNSQMDFFSVGDGKSTDDVHLLIVGDANADGKNDAIITRKGSFFRGYAHVKFCEEKKDTHYWGRFSEGIYRESGFCSFDAELDESPEVDEMFSIVDSIFPEMYKAGKKVTFRNKESEAPDLGKHGKEIRRLLKLSRELE